MATRRNISACRCLAFSSPISTMPSRLPVQSANWSSPCQCCTSFAVFPRGNYQIYNGKHSEHKVWAPRKVKGWELYELVEAKGQMGYIGGRRLKGSFVLKEVSTPAKQSRRWSQASYIALRGACMAGYLPR